MNGYYRASFLKVMMWLTLMSLTILGIIAKEAHAVQPKTIPALQQWSDGTGSYTLKATNRIVLNEADSSALTTIGQVFQSDMLALTGVTYPVITGTQSNLLTGDIFLALGDTDSTIGTEGYNMTIGNTIVISAAAGAGAFYGTRTILQLLKQSSTIQAGTAKDYPNYPFRALHVDNGRLFVTVDWLENHIKELAYLKMNIFHWHLAEDNNFRFESDTHPEIVAKQYYTKVQVAQMMALAAQYYVTIIPEFEMPGHMNWLLDVHPELQVVDSSGAANPDDIDLTNPASYSIISDLLNEWLPLIPGPYFHMGSDEYITDYTPYPQYLTYAQKNFGTNANAQDVYIHFLNWVDGIVNSYGKSTLAWDDNKTGGSVFTVNKNFIYDSWTFAAEDEINSGYSLNNSSQSVLYFVWYTNWQPMQTQLYEQWAPNQWEYASTGPILPYANGLLGAKLELWFDNNLCEQYSMAWLMHYSMRTVAQQTWASPLIFNQYTDFQSFSDQIGRAPGTTFPTTLPPTANPNGPYTANVGGSVTFSSAGSTTQNGSIVNYNWDFGDGTGISGTQANPTHTYTTAGTFTVLLIVTDSIGMTAGNQALVTIGGTTPVSVTISPTSANLAPGASQQFIATIIGSSNTNVTWTASGGTIASNGLYTAPTKTGTYTVTATSVADTSKSASATVTVSAVSVSISPTSVKLAPGGSQQFTATVAGSANPDVTWTASGGTIIADGLYTAPATTGSYTVTATSVADPAQSASATVTVTTSPISISISPTNVNLSLGEAQQFTATITGSDDTGVTWAVTGGIITSNGLYTAPTVAGKYTVTATSAADPSQSASATVTVTANSGSVSISPTTVTLGLGGTQQFTATVTGSENTEVTWTASGGTITSNGLFTAPTIIGSYIVTATSVANPTQSASATVTVTTDSVSVSISPTTVNLAAGGTQQFTATVTGSSNTNVTWTASSGTISSSGLYTAPTSTGSYKVTAASVADTAVSASATVTVSSESVSVTISPTTVNLAPEGTQQFTATVTGSSNTNVTWTASSGTITSSGLYIAPTTTGSYKVTATSVADTAISASATVTVSSESISVTISPTTVNLAPGGAQQFTATVTGSSNTNVTWTASSGTITSSGLYTAPTTIGSYKVTATSVADTAISASATVTVASESPAQQLQNDFRTTRLGGQATCTATQTEVTCQVPSSTQLIDISQPDSVLDTMVAESVTTIQTDVINVNPTAYSELSCQLLTGSVDIIQYNSTQKYAVFTASCQSPLPFPTNTTGIV